MAARNTGNAASVALALPAHDADHVRAVVEGFISGGYTFTGYKSRSDDSGVAEVSILSDAARRQDAMRCAGGRPHGRRPGEPCPRLGEHSARTT